VRCRPQLIPHIWPILDLKEFPGHVPKYSTDTTCKQLTIRMTRLPKLRKLWSVGHSVNLETLSETPILDRLKNLNTAKAVPLHTMEALEERGCIASTYS
jgi:hypothetical protein